MNAAVVIDCSKYLDRVLCVDAAARAARVQPGAVCDALREAAERHGLTFAPDPATHSRCTLGGMIGNNPCGPHSVMAGKTVENILRLEVLTYDGARFWCGPTDEAQYRKIVSSGGRQAEIYAGLRRIAERYGELIRARFPRIRRRVSGYNLDELLPENGFNVARALVGSEGTCALTPRAAHSVGRIGEWAPLASRFPALANLFSENLKSFAGVAPERELPKFARRSFWSTFRARAPVSSARCRLSHRSCLSVFRDELRELFPRDPRAARLALAATSLGEYLMKKNWRAELGGQVLMHGHCHQKALWGTAADARLLEGAGFGYRPQFYETSRRIAGLALLPALEAAPQATVLASGFSCRAQIESPGKRPTLHLAELLARALPA